MNDDIRRRLEAIQGIDWSTVKREVGEEYYGNWVKVGPIMMLSTDPDDEPWRGYPSYWPEERRRAYRERTQAERAQEDAIVEFLAHAADDIRRLLAEQGDR